MLTSSHFTMFSSVSMLTFVIKKKYSVKLKLLGKKKNIRFVSDLLEELEKEIKLKKTLNIYKFMVIYPMS